VFGIGGDENDVAGMELGHALGAVQFHCSLQDDERFRFAGMEMGGHALVGNRRHLAEPPAVTGVGG